MYIKSFRVEGLAGRQDPVELTLNPRVNAIFGPNGSGKTSLLRILHSALAFNGELLTDVPFIRAAVDVFSYRVKGVSTYLLDKEPRDENEPKGLAAIRLGKAPDKRKLKWRVQPEQEHPRFAHPYLATSRLYAASGTMPSEQTFGYHPRELTEADLESRFAENLTATWKEYSADVSRDVNEAQEKGLANILQGVISKYELTPSETDTDPNTSFVAVNNFLRRRRMREISKEEFLTRYKEQQFRSVVRDIEAVERDIDKTIQPREQFKTLVNELFIKDKSLTFSDKELEVAIRDKKIRLTGLSSGEKHLLFILVHTLLASATTILIDEPELSMHVDWQRRLISAMSTLNPSAQIIVATHSPEIIADLSDDQLFRI